MQIVGAPTLLYCHTMLLHISPLTWNLLIFGLNFSNFIHGIKGGIHFSGTSDHILGNIYVHINFGNQLSLLGGLCTGEKSWHGPDGHEDRPLFQFHSL